MNTSLGTYADCMANYTYIVALITRENEVDSIYLTKQERVI